MGECPVIWIVDLILVIEAFWVLVPSVSLIGILFAAEMIKMIIIEMQFT